ncbi:hypothetical protein ABW21_db0209642 [Orbilia brochopaga]|nr:hypothetical protein ABW21_db0209642 [Drechslerella brochopaga]
MSMYRSRSRMNNRWDGPRAEPTDMAFATSAGGGFAEVLRSLFLPFHLHDSYGDNTASHTMQYLQRLSYTRDDTRKYDLTGSNPHGTRFSAIFDDGCSDQYPSSGYLSIRLDKSHEPSRLSYRASVVNSARSNIVAEARLSLSEVKSIMIRRLPDGDYIDSEGYPGYLPSEDEYTYEVTIRLQPTSNSVFYTNPYSRRFIPGALAMPSTYLRSSGHIKDLARHAETIKFHIKAPTEAWTCLRDLQRNMGLREERHNSTHTFYYGLEHMTASRLDARRYREMSPPRSFLSPGWNFPDIGFLGSQSGRSRRGYEGRAARTANSRYGYDSEYY